MKYLYLLRHARAVWPCPGMRDFERPLRKGGRDDAAKLGRLMAKRNLQPKRIVCSRAQRTLETWAQVAKGLNRDEKEASFDERIYGSSSYDYLEVIKACFNESPLLIIGHNPMMEDLALALIKNGDAKALKILRGGFPTCGLAVISFKSEGGEIGLDKGRLEDFIL